MHLQPSLRAYYTSANLGGRKLHIPFVEPQLAPLSVCAWVLYGGRSQVLLLLAQLRYFRAQVPVGQLWDEAGVQVGAGVMHTTPP